MIYTIISSSCYTISGPREGCNVVHQTFRQVLLLFSSRHDRCITWCNLSRTVLTLTNILYFSLMTQWLLFGISLNSFLLNILQVRMKFWSPFKRLHQKTKYGGPTSAWVTTTAPYRRPSSATSWRMQAGECRQATLDWKKCDKSGVSWFLLWTINDIYS